MKHVRRSFILVLVALGLSACGVRGGLETPTENVATNSTEGAQEKAPKEHKPFILDGLIR